MPILPGTFLGGGVPRLQRICLDGIPFPTAPTLLFSARDLVNVNLRDIPDTGYVSPEAVVTSLAALSGLKYLTLGFRWGPSSSNPRRLPTTRTILPALTRFYFEGFFEYLEHFVAQIDAPQLDCLGIDYLEYWDEEEIADYQIPQLCKFVDRSEKLKLSWFRRMELRIQLNTVSIEFVHGDQPSFQLSIQDEGITQVLGQICGTLSNVDCLFIGSGRTEPDELLGDDIEWLQLLRTLTAVKALCVQDELSHHVALALEHVTWEPERAAEVLPALELLCLQDWPVASVEKFVAARRNVGCPVTFVKTVRELQDRLEFNVGELANVPYYSVIPDIMQ
ncbi:hypothetical protein EDB86DRAFT_3071930 [Lactarius hatsudake]|nr:hypothetical protein EDB86DRAFT_3071930 [Lactarius hatsudake]